MGYIALCCNRFVIFSHKSYIKKKKQKKNRKSKENIFNLAVQYREKYGRSGCLTTAFIVASGHLGLERKTLCSCPLPSTVPQSPQKCGHLQRTRACDSTRQHRLTYLTGCVNTHVHIFGSSQLKGPVEGPYCICVFSRAEAVILDCNVPLSLLSSITELLGSEQASYEHTFS